MGAHVTQVTRQPLNARGTTTQRPPFGTEHKQLRCPHQRCANSWPRLDKETTFPAGVTIRNPKVDESPDKTGCVCYPRFKRSRPSIVGAHSIRVTRQQLDTEVFWLSRPFQQELWEDRMKIHDRSMYESRLLCAYELGQHLCARRPTLPAQGRASVSLRAHDLRWQASSCVNDGSLLFAPTKALVGHTERGLEIRRLRADSPLPARSKGKTQKLADRVSQNPFLFQASRGSPLGAPRTASGAQLSGSPSWYPPSPRVSPLTARPRGGRAGSNRGLAAILEPKYGARVTFV